MTQQIAVEAALEQLANAIYRRGMSLPAILFLETFKPLSTVIYAASLVAVPIVTSMCGIKLAQTFLKVMESRDNIDRLIGLVEEKLSDRGCA